MIWILYLNFFSRPENLEKITPSAMGFNIITPTPIEMKEGAIIDYTVKILGVPIIVRIINYYAKFGFKDFIIASGYKSKIIKKYFEKNPSEHPTSRTDLFFISGKFRFFIIFV